MQGSADLELLAGVLDATLHLLKGGYLTHQPTIEKIFAVLVSTLAVPQRRRVPTGVGSDDYANQLFTKALDCKSLICHILNAILTYRLIVRTGTVLTSTS